jgi:uncharacterized protein (TIGR02246 family)
VFGRIAIVSSLFVAAALIGGQSIAQSPGTTSADETAVRAIVQALEDTWNEHDMAAQAELFHEDAVFISWFGSRTVGRPAIRDMLARAHDSVFGDSRQTKTIEDLSFVAPDVVVAHLYGTNEGDSRQPDRTILSRNTIVVTKRDGVWRIIAFHNTRQRDPNSTD